MYIRNPYAAWTGCQYVIKEGVLPVWVSMATSRWEEYFEISLAKGVNAQ